MKTVYNIVFLSLFATGFLLSLPVLAEAHAVPSDVDANPGVVRQFDSEGKAISEIATGRGFHYCESCGKWVRDGNFNDAPLIQPSYGTGKPAKDTKPANKPATANDAI